MTEKTTKKVKKESEVHNNYVDSFSLIAFLGVCLLLFLTPFFRGLFFPDDQKKALLFIALSFGLILISKWRRRDNSFLSHPLDYLMVAFPLAYIISAFNAVNYGLALDEAVDVLLCFALYWCVVNLTGDRKKADILLCVIFSGGVAVSLAGLMAFTGLININDGVQQAVRIASTLQYPNALAGYLVIVFTAGIYLWRKSSFCESDAGEKINNGRYNINISYIITVGNFLLAAVIFGTRSNGGYLTFALAILMLIVLLPGWNRLFVFVHLITLIPPAAASIYYFQHNATGQHYVKAWFFLLLGIFFVVFIQWLYLRCIPVLITQLQKKSVQKVVFAGISFLVILAIGFPVIYLNNLLLQPQNYIKIRSLMDRLYFIIDAFQMFKERPILGWGGGGWQEAYSFYKSYSYASNQVHSYFMQIAVETGIVGLVVVVGIWTFFLISGYRAYLKRENINDRFLVSALTVGVLSLGFHSLFDFDLSLSALTLVLFTFIAMIRVLEKSPPKLINEKNNKVSKPVFIMVSVVCLVVVSIVSCLLTAKGYAEDAMLLLKQRKYVEAAGALEKAVTFNFFKAEYNYGLAELYRITGQKDKALEEAIKAANKSKYNTDRRSLLASLAFERGDFEETARYAEEVLRLSPWVISNYEYVGIVYKTMGLAELKKGRDESVNRFFRAAAVLPDTVTNKINSLDINRRKLILDFGVTGKLILTSGVSNLMLGDNIKAESQLKEAALNQETKGEAFVWLGLLSEKMGDPVSANSYLNKAKEVSPEYEKTYVEFKQYFKNK